MDVYFSAKQTLSMCSSLMAELQGMAKPASTQEKEQRLRTRPSALQGNLQCGVEQAAVQWQTELRFSFRNWENS